MAFRVLKFGGSSVADATAMSRVLDIVGGETPRGRVVLVSSAISGCTDGLLACAAGDDSGLTALRNRHVAIVRRLFTGSERADAIAELDRLFEEMSAAPSDEKVTFGELLSTRILARKLACDGYETQWVDSRELVVKDDLPETYRRIRDAVQATSAAVIVAPGFICCDATGKVCTLGRGGSDYSAALYAAALQAESLQIWTDVPGIMTANPKEVPAARTVPEMSYRAALEMAEHGAKVLYAPTVAPAMEAGIDIEIRNTFAPAGRYTRIAAVADAAPWVGVTSSGEEICLVGSQEADPGAATGQVREALRVAGLADSRHYRIDLGGGVTSLDGGVAGDFVDAVIDLAPRGAVFVDCTDSETLYRRYPDLFRAGLNVVSSNRRSLAVPYVEYAALQAAARENGCFFRYETTVGAALPMLESLAIGANSSDEVERIEAVVSCTLNQILSAYGEGPTFASLVRAAQEAGLTEPDPRLDLGGRDALRKLLILAREAGVQLEEQDVDIRPIIPVALFGVPLEDFYRGLEEMEPVFAEAHRQALRAGCHRRFVACLEKTPAGYRAGIRVQQVPEDHPAYYLKGTENAILIRSAFHPTPIVIQGPGEGARQAAASLLNDILR